MPHEKLKKILWKVDGMDFIDNPAGSKGVFQLKYGDLLDLDTPKSPERFAQANPQSERPLSY